MSTRWRAGRYWGCQAQADSLRRAATRFCGMILKSETYHFHRLDLTRQAGFIVTIYDEDGLRLASTPPLPTPSQAFEEARKIVDNKIEGPKKLKVPPSVMPP